MHFQPPGTWNSKLDKLHDDIQISKPSLSLNNLIAGGMYFDVAGKVEGHNATTGDHLTIDLQPKTWRKASKVEGVVNDKDGNKVYDISGHWNKEIMITNLEGEVETIWSSPEPIENAAENFNFTYQGILLNHITPAMSGTVAPTDSRFRMDQRYFEEGKEQEAEEEKKRLEVK